MKYKGFSLQEKQAAVRDALKRMEPVHIHWRMLESIYRTGAQRELTMLDLSRILPFPVPGAFLRTVNMVLPHLSMIINTVAARDPKMVVTPMGGDQATIERNASIAKAVLEYFWRRTDSTSTLHDMTQDMVLLGNGFAKVGWAYSETTVDRTAEEMTAELDELVATAQQVADEYGQPLDEGTLKEIVDSITLTQNMVEVDEPYVEYVAPYDIFVPANARRLNTTRWISQRLRLPIEDLKANELFKKSARDNIKADTGYLDPTTIARFEETEQALPAVFEHATVFEFYDMQERTMCVFQIDSDEYLYEGPIPYDHRFPPFVHMRNFNDGSAFWSFGDLENVAGLQLMVNEIMVAEINDLKRVGNKYFINKKVLTADLAKALQENKPDQVIPLDLPANMSMSEVLQPVQRLSTPSDNYIMENKLQDYMQRILGISDLQVGAISQASRVPATAAAAVEGASTTRSLDKMVSVEKASREIGLRVLALCQQFLDSNRAIRIAGPDAPMWLDVVSEDIEGEFSIETEGGSTQAINPVTRARQGLEMLNIVVPAIAQLGYDPSNALRTALSYMGLNPDHLLIRPQAEQVAPEMAAGMEGGVDQFGNPLLASPEMASPDMNALMNLGAPPVPGAVEGGTL